MLHFTKADSYQAHHATLRPIGHKQICLETYGRFISNGAFHWEQVSERPCFHIITGGSGIFVSNGKEYLTKRGSLFTFFPGDHIIYYDELSSPWRYRWCSLVGPAKAILQEVGITPSQPLHQLTDLKSVILALDAVENSCKNDASASSLGVIAIHEILAQLNSPEKIPSNKALLARNLIDSRNYDSPTVNEISASLGINRSTLFRSFKKEYGYSIKQYLDRRRLEKAAELLLVSKESISAIGKSCGYHDPLYFSRAFSKAFGKSPRGYREEFISR